MIRNKLAAVGTALVLLPASAGLALADGSPTVPDMSGMLPDFTTLSAKLVGVGAAGIVITLVMIGIVKMTGGTKKAVG